jgi:hypothetical protein
MRNVTNGLNSLPGNGSTNKGVDYYAQLIEERGTGGKTGMSNPISEVGSGPFPRLFPQPQAVSHTRINKMRFSASLSLIRFIPVLSIQ